MKKGLLFVVLMVLLVSSCGGEKVLVFTPTEIPPPPIPGPRNIPALAQNTETPLPAKIGMVFLVDRSKSLNGCNKTQARFGIPNFFISLFKTLPVALPEWPKIGLSFFGNEVYFPLQSASQVSFDIGDYSKKLTLSDKQNEYDDYLTAALDTLNASGAEEKIIVLISDGEMDETQDREGERKEVRDWFMSNGLKITGVKVALFHLDCGTPKDDLDMWENVDNIGSEFVFRGYDDFNLGFNVQKLVQNTSISKYLPTLGGWWIGNNLDEASFLQPIVLPGDVYQYKVSVITYAFVDRIEIEGESALDTSHPDIYSKLFKFEEGPAQYCGERTVIMQAEKSPDFFGYYFVQPQPLSDFFNSSFLIQPENAAAFSNVTLFDNPKYIFWNDHAAQISIPDRILGSNTAFELMDKYSICYAVWVSVPGEKNETGLQESQIDIIKFSLQDFMNGKQIVDLKDLTSIGRKDINIWVDVVKFPDNSDRFLSIRRQELTLSHYYYPEYQQQNLQVNGSQIDIGLRYASPDYYMDEGKLFVYALTKKEKLALEKGGCNNHPIYSGFEVTLEDGKWYAAPNYPGSSNAFASIDESGFVKINLEQLVGRNSSLEKCGYEKIVIQWNGNGDGVDKIRPSLVCNISTSLSCNIMSSRAILSK